jgi:hypothetical protein
MKTSTAMNDTVRAGSTLCSPGRCGRPEPTVPAALLGQPHLALPAPVLDCPDWDPPTSRASVHDATAADPSTLQEPSS